MFAIRIVVAAFWFVLGLPGDAGAGVTIHYSGAVASAFRAKAVLAAATRYAGDHKWLVMTTPQEVVLYPAEWCEPIHVAFNGTELAKDFVKTQFAGPAVHRDVVGLFRRLKPLMIKLVVNDESGFWDDNDYSKLEARLAADAAMIERARLRRRASGPVKLPDGRIADMVQ